MSCQYFAGFETGDASEFPEVGGTTSIVTSPVLSGGYCGKVLSVSSFNYFKTRTGLALSTAYIRCRFRVSIDFNPASAATINMIIPDTGATTVSIRIAISTGGAVTIYCHNGIGTPVDIGPTNTAISLDTTYLVELRQVISATVGEVTWKLNGTQIGASTGLNTGTTNIDAVFFNVEPIASAACTIYFDDIYVDNASYPGAGRCVTRQGKTGTPTNDAFTKTGAATSTLCWSTTPYGTAANCNSSTSSAAQTMLTATFGSTQSGHGTETIASGDTINACKVAFVGKVGSASSQSIRQRLNSVNTDASKSMTTADAYYEGAIFTDTLTNINASEIGCVKGANATLTTIEDAWFMVDYTAVTMTPLTAAFGDTFSLADNTLGREPSFASFGENFG